MDLPGGLSPLLAHPPPAEELAALHSVSATAFSRLHVCPSAAPGGQVCWDPASRPPGGFRPPISPRTRRPGAAPELVATLLLYAPSPGASATATDAWDEHENPDNRPPLPSPASDADEARASSRRTLGPGRGRRQTPGVAVCPLPVDNPVDDVSFPGWTALRPLFVPGLGLLFTCGNHSGAVVLAGPASRPARQARPGPAPGRGRRWVGERPGPTTAPRRSSRCGGAVDVGARSPPTGRARRSSCWCRRRCRRRRSSATSRPSSRGCSPGRPAPGTDRGRGPASIGRATSGAATWRRSWVGPRAEPGDAGWATSAVAGARAPRPTAPSGCPTGCGRCRPGSATTCCCTSWCTSSRPTTPPGSAPWSRRTRKPTGPRLPRGVRRRGPPRDPGRARPGRRYRGRERSDAVTGDRRRGWCWSSPATTPPAPRRRGSTRTPSRGLPRRHLRGGGRPRRRAVRASWADHAGRPALAGLPPPRRRRTSGAARLLREVADEVVLVPADVPDLPGLVLAKQLKVLHRADVAVAPERGGPGCVALGLPAAGGVLGAARGPRPRPRPEVDPCGGGPVARGAVETTPDWHRLRGPAAVHRLDPALEGWEETRALLPAGRTGGRSGGERARGPGGRRPRARRRRPPRPPDADPGVGPRTWLEQDQPDHGGEHRVDAHEHAEEAGRDPPQRDQVGGVGHARSRGAPRSRRRAGRIPIGGRARRAAPRSAGRRTRAAWWPPPWPGGRGADDRPAGSAGCRTPSSPPRADRTDPEPVGRGPGQDQHVDPGPGPAAQTRSAGCASRRARPRAGRGTPASPRGRGRSG